MVCKWLVFLIGFLDLIGGMWFVEGQRAYIIIKDTCLQQTGLRLQI